MNEEILFSKAELELFFYTKFESFATFLEGSSERRVSLGLKYPSSPPSN